MILRARISRLAIVALGAAAWAPACSLLADTDGLVGGRRDAAAIEDVTVADVTPDVPGVPDGGDAEALDADAGSPCPADAGDPSLLAYWSFDEGAGSLVHDCSGHGLDGKLLEAGTWGAGHAGSALVVTRTAGCVDVGPTSVIDVTRAYTVTAWVKVTAYPSSTELAGYIVGQTTDVDQAGWRLATTDPQSVSGAIAKVPDAGRFDDSFPSADVGKWMHVAMRVVPSGSLTLFMGGVVQRNPSGVPAQLIAQPGARLRLGCRSDDQYPFDGTLDEVRIYGRALSDAEIAALAR